MQDTDADARFAGADVARLRQRPDGSWAGTLRVTARWRGDAAHQWLYLTTALPAGVRLEGTEPIEAPCWDECYVPGGPFMEGERRTFDLLLAADPGTAPGRLGTGTATLSARWYDDVVPDPAPGNNTVSFAVVATP